MFRPVVHDICGFFRPERPLPPHLLQRLTGPLNLRPNICVYRHARIFAKCSSRTRIFINWVPESHGQGAVLHFAIVYPGPFCNFQSDGASTA
jgi:hypothetical protein